MTATLIYGTKTHLLILVGFLYTKIKPIGEYTAFRPETYSLSFGSVAFLFCVHFLILPIEESMKEQRKFPLSLTVTLIRQE